MNKLDLKELKERVSKRRNCDRITDIEFENYIKKLENLLHYLVVHDYRIKTKYLRFQPHLGMKLFYFNKRKCARIKKWAERQKQYST